MEYPIPLKSHKAFEWLIEKSIRPRNPSLIFDRFTPRLDTVPDKEKGTVKSDFLKLVRDSAKLTEEQLFNEWNTRWERLIASAEAKYFELQTDWRLIAGLGKKGSLEVGFTFHRYGFPYLPGSSLKGLARAYGLLEIAEAIGGEMLKKADNDKPLTKLDEALSQDEEKKFKDALNNYKVNQDSPALNMAEAFRCIFGTTEQAGKAIFFDAIPKSVPTLDLDIMNPHYPDYYNDRDGKQGVFPTNWQSPIPVQFLTVASGTVFRFAIGWRSSPQDNDPDSEKKQTEFSWWKGEQIERIKNQAPSDHPRMQKLARRWLEGGLLNLGAGGKTSAGYGYFKE